MAKLRVGRLILTGILLPLSLATIQQRAAGQASLKRSDGHLELTWPTLLTNASSQVVLPEYEVQFSRDLSHWAPIGGKVKGIAGRSGPSLSISLAEQPAPVFFRVNADFDSTTANRVGSGGAEVLGYNEQFQRELGGLGLLSLEDFATNAPSEPYLPALTWDPRTAQFWTNFDSPRLFYAGYGVYNGFGQSIAYNYQPNPAELAVFLTNGFVVSERMGSVTFGDAYYRVYNADLPVFVTADSILHAWHMSYDSVLSELEETVLSTMLEQLLTNMSAQLPQTWLQYGAGPLGPGILDADFFLTVARSLWTGQQVPNSLNITGESDKVRNAINAVNGLGVYDVPLFGGRRLVDFSQFAVRGHYAISDRLRRYFRAMMWCNRIDLRLATFDPNRENDIRQLGTALVLQHLLTQSGQMTNWSMMERATRLFVGLTDSLTFPELEGLLSSAGITSPADVPDLLTLTNLQTRLLSGELGVQNIPGDSFYSPLSPAQLKLPRSFTLTGQKFVMDSWAMSQVVFDRVLWDPADPRTIFGKVIRRKPSCLDVAFCVFANDNVVPEIVSRIRNTNGVPFRDGLPYQHNLLAVRKTIDGQDSSVWADSIYTAWLAALRTLSAPTTDPQYPEAMRTRAWAMKTLNTQFASWTQLRHDTVLYAKQGETPELLCGYPFGFVEPRPEFWQQMQVLAQMTAEGISRLPVAGSVTIPSPLQATPITLNLAVLKSNQVALFNTFSNRMGMLKDMAERELAQQPLTAEQTLMLQDVVERGVDYMGVRHFSGWYPALFYRNAFKAAIDATGFSYSSGFPPAPECDSRDVLVADVHTDLPDQITGDPGAVIHEAVGNVNMMLIAIDNGTNRMVYAGPVLSHYEFELPGVSGSSRLNDAQWKARLDGGAKPPSPPWTESFLVPGTFQIPIDY